MLSDIFFFDSYAILEILRGSENYKKYKECIIVTTKLNLFEVFYSILKNTEEKNYDLLFERYYESAIDFDINVIKEAAKLRLKYKKNDLSMTDCIGYILAKEWNIKFLTGDKEFENMENVEFVK